jgi:hypothetical protein
MDVNIYLYYGYQTKVDPLLEFLTVSAESRERGKGGADTWQLVLGMQKPITATQCNGIML